MKLLTFVYVRFESRDLRDLSCHPVNAITVRLFEHINIEAFFLFGKFCTNLFFLQPRYIAE